MKTVIEFLRTAVRNIRQTLVKTGSQNDLEEVKLLDELHETTRKRNDNAIIGQKMITVSTITDAIATTSQEKHNRHNYPFASCNNPNGLRLTFDTAQDTVNVIG